MHNIKSLREVILLISGSRVRFPRGAAAVRVPAMLQEDISLSHCENAFVFMGRRSIGHDAQARIQALGFNHHRLTDLWPVW
jgi:hypothetical protein